MANTPFTQMHALDLTVCGLSNVPSIISLWFNDFFFVFALV